MKFTIDTRPKRRPKIIFVNVKRLAQQTGYHKSHISRVIRKKTNPSVSCLMGLADALDLKLDDLIRKIDGRKLRIRREGPNGRKNGRI